MGRDRKQQKTIVISNRRQQIATENETGRNDPYLTPKPGVAGSSPATPANEIKNLDRKVLLAIKSMGGESAEAWRTVLADLINFVYLKPLYLKARWFRRGYAWVDGH
jgi:hypothetical protein